MNKIIAGLLLLISVTAFASEVEKQILKDGDTIDVASGEQVIIRKYTRSGPYFENATIEKQVTDTKYLVKTESGSSEKLQGKNIFSLNSNLCMQNKKANNVIICNQDVLHETGAGEITVAGIALQRRSTYDKLDSSWVPGFLREDTSEFIYKKTNSEKNEYESAEIYRVL